MPLYEEIEKREVPILVHTGQTNIQLRSPDPTKRLATDSRFRHPFHLDKISRLFPGIPFVMAHCGYPHLMEAWSVAHANQNVYLDISGSGPWTDGIPLFYNAIGGQELHPHRLQPGPLGQRQLHAAGPAHRPDDDLHAPDRGEKE